MKALDNVLTWVLILATVSVIVGGGHADQAIEGLGKLLAGLTKNHRVAGKRRQLKTSIPGPNSVVPLKAKAGEDEAVSKRREAPEGTQANGVERLKTRRN